MTSLSDFPITRSWPPLHPERLQLYAYPTPNGVKISMMLEEIGLPYDAYLVGFDKSGEEGKNFTATFPNNKIPAIIDPNGPDGKPMALFESGAIMLYLAEKTGTKLMLEGAARWQVIQWIMWRMAGLGPMFGQFGFFHLYAGTRVEDPIPRERYRLEAERLLKVLDGQLEGREWVVGDYSLADISIAPWVDAFVKYYKGHEKVDWASLRNVPAYLERFRAIPAYQRSLNIPPVPEK
ncbi:glutathione S-transferase [Xinfangfangia sp. D13-10-4-6]|uniref:glutathione S-transferase N-terminal domain-containing protein n=1 Tax=Pseudogemmobacter hezensis TaxID=2737662 RepID=UPI0015581BDF|nr:glutathione S-transferase N-terminal domain-containing protein [Pseudogemmobacter hezensis]NPD16604.1 glutathione S-transferase [Pseudogemmobacter hezensis]